MWVDFDVYIIKVPFYGLKLHIFWPLTFLLLWVNPLRPFLREISGGGRNFAPPQGSSVIWDVRVRRVKVLILFSTVSKDQKTSSILKVGFALSKWPHLHRVYLVTVFKRGATAVLLFQASFLSILLTNNTLNNTPNAIVGLCSSFWINRLQF